MSAPEYPSYEALQQSGRLFGPTLDFCRIRWRIGGSIATSIFVIQDALSPNAPHTLETYQSEDYIHPISDLPLTAPPCSSVELSLEMLNRYTEDWQDIHTRHAEDDPEHCCEEDVPGPGPTLKVEAPSGGVLTIGDFIATVHPWLCGLEGQLRAAKGVHNAMPLSRRFELFVRPTPLTPMRIVDGNTLGKLVFNWDTMAQQYAKHWPRWLAEQADSDRPQT